MAPSSPSLPLSAAPFASPSTSSAAANPLVAALSFLRGLASFCGDAALAATGPPTTTTTPSAKGLDLALAAGDVARALSGTSVFTVCNSGNEFVLVTDPNSRGRLRSLGLLCFRHEDADALLAQVNQRHPVLGKGARVVPITLDQAYMLKIEGIAFRFIPDPLQIRHALELKSSDSSGGFDGVPVFQSDLLVIKKKNKLYCPIYFQKEDIERELVKASNSLRGKVSHHINVGTFEDVLKKMEMNEKNSGWDDLIFIPPGKSYTQHISEVSA